MKNPVASVATAALFAFACSAAGTADPPPRTTLTLSTSDTEGATRPGGTLVQRIGRKLTFTISRTPVDHAAARVTNYAGKYAYPDVGYDAFNNVHLSYPVGLALVSAGYQQRVQQCCPSSHTSQAAPDTYFYWYVQADMHFGPNSQLGPRYELTLQDAQIPHATNPRFPDPNYPAASEHFIASGGPKNKLTYAATITVPFDRDQRIGGFVTATNSWDYFQSSPIMYLYDEINYGVTGIVTRHVTLNVSLQNVEQYHQPFPYAEPNTINRHTLVTQLLYGTQF